MRTVTRVAGLGRFQLGMIRLSRSIRLALAAGGAVLVLGGAAVGIAVAQTPTPTAQSGQARYQAFVDALARRLGISSATLETAIGGARTDTGLPANGQGGPGFGPGGRGGPGGPGGNRWPGGPRGRGAFGIDWTAAASVIGIPAAQLRTELAGKSLAQVAAAHGKTADNVVAALKSAADTRIDQAVAAGRLTADQAATRKTQIESHLSQFVNQVIPRGGHGPKGPRSGA